ncbi:hypothetical protein NpNSSI1_00005374 [Neofusicoccum parvum]|nr:hypothetical protein NpNSSI1_00005374 [Neofusicoccum parvum]
MFHGGTSGTLPGMAGCCTGAAYAGWSYPAAVARDFACAQTADGWTTVLPAAVDGFFGVPETHVVDVVWAPETAVLAATSEAAGEAGASSSARTAAGETGGAGGGGAPVGAIVGGVVGGVVGLAFVVGVAVVFCCLAKRRRNGA